MREPADDGLRATDPSFQRAVDERLTRELDRRAIATVQLSAEDRDGWIDAVEAEAWRLLEPPQMQLL